MLNRDFLRSIKSSCVGIGLQNVKSKQILGVFGTGFIVDPDGFILTAKHIIDYLRKEQEKYEQKGTSVAICALQPRVENSKLIIGSRGLVERRSITIQPIPKFPVQHEYDVTICRMGRNEKCSNFLKIKKSGKIELFEEILVCGYPGGSSTFNIFDLESGLRVSPLIQSGRISGVMPIDDIVSPTGIQTDIVGIGGSSGSPIIEIGSGQVIGIAQKVLSPNVLDVDDKVIGSGQIGLIFGISNYGLAATVEKVIKQMKEELDENGILKPEFKEKYEKSDITSEIAFSLKNPDNIQKM